MNSSPDIVASAFQMLAALGVVLGGLLVIFYLMKRYLKRDLRGSNRQLIKLIASQYVGIKKNIALVQVPGSVLVVGISNDRISLLTKIDDQSALDAIQLECRENFSTFSDHLQRLTTKFKSAKISK